MNITISQLRAMISSLETQGYGDALIEMNITARDNTAVTQQLSGMLTGQVVLMPQLTDTGSVYVSISAEIV